MNSPAPSCGEFPNSVNTQQPVFRYFLQPPDPLPCQASGVERADNMLYRAAPAHPHPDDPDYIAGPSDWSRFRCAKASDFQ